MGGMVGAAANVLGIGAEEEAPLPQYEKFNWDQSAFTGSPAEMAARQNESDMLRRGMREMQFSKLGRENAGMFQEALGQQRAAMLGQAPSVAQIQMQDAMNRAGQQQQSAAGSARGAGSLALAQMNASNQISGIQQNAATQGALLRAKEMEAARAGMFSAIDSDRAAATAGAAAKAKAMQGYGVGLDTRFEGDRNRGMAYQAGLRGEHAAAQGRSFQNVQSEKAAQALEQKAAADQASANAQSAVAAGQMAADQYNKEQDRKVRLSKTTPAQ